MFNVIYTFLQDPKDTPPKPVYETKEERRVRRVRDMFLDSK